MPAPIKKFTAARNANRTEAVPFELDWYDDSDEPHTEDFVCYPGKVPGALSFDLVLVDEDSEPMWEFFQAAMQEGYTAFRKFVRDPDHGIDANALADIVRWINSYETGLPTTPSPS